MNYLFEYFNSYIKFTEADKKNIEKNEKLIKYKNQLHDYSDHVQNWLLLIYDTENVMLARTLTNYIRNDPIFLIQNSPSDIRKFSYIIYAEFVKKYKFLDKYTNDLLYLLEDIHRIMSNNYFIEEEDLLPFNDKLKEYIQQTLKDYRVNLLAWASLYAEFYCDNDVIWPRKATEVIAERYSSHKIEKVNVNYFNLDTLYARLSYLPYIRGKKHYLEVLVMYFWANNIDEVDEQFYLKFMGNHLR